MWQNNILPHKTFLVHPQEIPPYLIFNDLEQIAFLLGTGNAFLRGDTILNDYSYFSK